MNWMAEKVREFHVLMKQPHPDNPALDEVRVKLRAKLILEEAIETVRALGCDVNGQVVLLNRDGVEPDWSEVIDGLCDLLYVTFGCAVEMGVNLVPFFYEVHRANMQKAGGPVRADGKVLKPEGWQPPQIKMLLERQLARGAAESTETAMAFDPTDYDDISHLAQPEKQPFAERVDHPAHYGGANNPYEAIKVIEAWNLDFCLGNAVKYIARAGKKDDELEDLRKAAWYLRRRIEQLGGGG